MLKYFKMPYQIPPYAKYAIALVAFSVLLFVVLISFPREIISAIRLSYQALTPQPERFTELYFENHTQLPKKVQLGSQQEFVFTVINREHERFIYQYQAFISLQNHNSEQKISIKEGDIILKHNERATIPVPFTLTDSAEKVKMTVELINKRQPIHFWIEISK